MIVIGERTIHHEIRFVDLLTQSAEDSSSIVRRVAAEFLIREMVNLGEESIYFARQFAKDKSPAVAERGNFALKKLSV
ncbi:hypothetical protein [Algibacillus agarilyticus]|uniref:hypothetical protein n=1 Tax=Algibacillus agarilyticus TaxID=2234133 RepID=UPI0013003945|nr:hypothetical protein [Algibacillus agarilyticus]